MRGFRFAYLKYLATKISFQSSALTIAWVHL